LRIDIKLFTLQNPKSNPEKNQVTITISKFNKNPLRKSENNKWVEEKLKLYLKFEASEWS
jgi:hypothetical protein